MKEATWKNTGLETWNIKNYPKRRQLYFKKRMAHVYNYCPGRPYLYDTTTNAH